MAASSRVSANPASRIPRAGNLIDIFGTGVYWAGSAHASLRVVSGSRSPLKNLVKICLKTEPGGETLAKSDADDRSFMSSGEPKIS